MPVGLLGRKLGMTRRYDERGQGNPVTVLQLGPCTVVRVIDRAGRRSIQLGYGVTKPKRLSRAEMGHLKKASIETPLRHLQEFTVGQDEEFTVGQELTVGLFEADYFVDVTARSIGRGFQGGMRRWGWKGGKASHGSMTHRRIGSMGQTTTPGRVLRGHHLPGHMGNKTVTVQNLRIIDVRPEQNLLLVRGPVPGHESCVLTVRKALKRTNKYTPPQASGGGARGIDAKKAKTAARKK